MCFIYFLSFLYFQYLVIFICCHYFLNVSIIFYIELMFPSVPRSSLFLIDFRIVLFISIYFHISLFAPREPGGLGRRPRTTKWTKGGQGEPKKPRGDQRGQGGPRRTKEAQGGPGGPKGDQGGPRGQGGPRRTNGDQGPRGLMGGQGVHCPCFVFSYVWSGA